MGIIGVVLLAVDVVAFVGSIVTQIVLIQRAQRAPDAGTRLYYETRSQGLLKVSSGVVLVLTIAFVADMLTVGI